MIFFVTDTHEKSYGREQFFNRSTALRHIHFVRVIKLTPMCQIILQWALMSYHIEYVNQYVIDHQCVFWKTIIDK